MCSQSMSKACKGHNMSPNETHTTSVTAVHNTKGNLINTKGSVIKGKAQLCTWVAYCKLSKACNLQKPSKQSKFSCSSEPKRHLPQTQSDAARSDDT
jgi:hypothetical protein